jgi:hypothetical protein
MTAPVANAVQVACPNCRTPLRAPIVTLVDVGQQPELKTYLLSGQLNTVVCPNCGYAGMLAAPLVYHDPAKQLFLVYVPQQINARPGEEERFIGDATRAVMATLPANASKAYLLNPRRFLTLGSLVDAVLEADGITKEMIEAQRARVDLIARFAEIYEQGGDDRDARLKALVDEHRDELDHEFFTILTAYAEAGARAQQDGSAGLLMELRDKLAALSGFAGGDADEPSVEAVVEKLIAASDEELDQQIAEVRPVLDYDFFRALTERIERAEAAGDCETAARLTARRAAILATVERLDAEARAMFEAGSNLLKRALEAADPAGVLRADPAALDEAFFLVLETNRAAAERAGRADVIARLDAIRQQATQIVEESLPPEERFISELLRAPDDSSAADLLRGRSELVNTAFVRRLNELADELEKNGAKPQSARLRQLARQAGAMLF